MESVVLGRDETRRHPDPGDDDDPNRLDIKLEPEFYTCSFVAPLDLTHVDSRQHRICSECFFAVAMLFVACMQCLTVFGMSTYLVERDKGYTDEFKLATGLFTEGGAPMSSATSANLCGSFSHIPLKHFAGTDHLKLPDGTIFAGTEDAPIFHSYKSPSGAWVFDSVTNDGSYVDRLMRVLHDSSIGKVNWGHLRVEYGVLFIIMVAVLWFHVLFELRKIVHLHFVLDFFMKKGIIRGSKETHDQDPDGRITIQRLNVHALVVGYICIFLRFTVAIMMLVWGTSLLAASWNKLSLVLNSLAIGIVFELDTIIAYAVVDHKTMMRIENIEPVKITIPWHGTCFGGNTLCFNSVMMIAVFVGAVTARLWQVDQHEHQLHNAAALCLFAGPPPQAQKDVLSPVPGFCESLLSMTCAPNVTGPGKKRGPCVVTDQNIFEGKSLALHADAQLFEGMYDAEGRRRSIADWGPPRAELSETRTWANDAYLNLFRKACVQLYQPENSIDYRVVDADSGTQMHSAPFYCRKEELFQAVFGKIGNDFDRWSSKFDLLDPDIVAALDGCQAKRRLPQYDFSISSATGTESRTMLNEKRHSRHTDSSIHLSLQNPVYTPHEAAQGGVARKKLRRRHHHVHHEHAHHEISQGQTHHHVHREIDQHRVT